MKKKKVLIIFILIALMCTIPLVYISINKIKRRYNDFNETWILYQNAENYHDNFQIMDINKHNDLILIEYHNKACKIKYRGNTGPYYCESISNWVVTFNKSFDALVIEEYDNEIDVRDGIYSGLPKYYLFTLDSSRLSKSNANDLIKKIVGNEIVLP